MSVCTDISACRDAAIMVAPTKIATLPKGVQKIILADFLTGKDLANLCVCKREWKEAAKENAALLMKIRQAKMDWICEQNADYTQLLRSIH